MKDAVNKIRQLKTIQPNPYWFKNQRNILLQQISQVSGKKSRFAWNNLPGFIFSPSILKPVMVSFMVLFLIFGSGFVTVLAAKNSLPGDLLYPVKIAVEDVKIRISSSEAKPQLQADFMCNRAQELSQIINSTGDSIRAKENVVQTVDKLQVQVNNTRASLSSIKQTEPQKAVETMNAISNKITESEKALTEAQEKFAEGFKGQTPKDAGEVAAKIDAAAKNTSVLASELKEAKSGIEVQMEVKNTKPQVEIFNEASVSFDEINK